jgi:hypothetical protein
MRVMYYQQAPIGSNGLMQFIKSKTQHLQNYCKHLLKIIQCSTKNGLHGIERGEIKILF